MTSPDNAELVRGLSTALNTRDEETFAEVCDQAFAKDAQVRDLASAPDQPDVLIGPAEITAGVLLCTAAFDEPAYRFPPASRASDPRGSPRTA